MIRKLKKKRQDIERRRQRDNKYSAADIIEFPEYGAFKDWEELDNTLDIDPNVDDTNDIDMQASVYAKNVPSKIEVFDGGECYLKFKGYDGHYRLGDDNSCSFVNTIREEKKQELLLMEKQSQIKALKRKSLSYLSSHMTMTKSDKKLFARYLPLHLDANNRQTIIFNDQTKLPMRIYNLYLTLLFDQPIQHIQSYTHFCKIVETLTRCNTTQRLFVCTENIMPPKHSHLYHEDRHYHKISSCSQFRNGYRHGFSWSCNDEYSKIYYEQGLKQFCVKLTFHTITYGVFLHPALECWHTKYFFKSKSIESPYLSIDYNDPVGLIKEHDVYKWIQEIRKQIANVVREMPKDLHPLICDYLIPIQHDQKYISDLDTIFSIPSLVDIWRDRIAPDLVPMYDPNDDLADREEFDDDWNSNFLF